MNILIIFFIIYILGFGIFSWAGLYHLWKYGYVGDMTKPVIFIYSILSLLVITGTIFIFVLRVFIGE